jgi:hypothetical protein
VYHRLQKVSDSNSSNTSVANRNTLVARVTVYHRNKLLTSSEIEEMIVRLHKEGRTTREISKVVRKNFTYIGAVLRRRFPEEYVNNNSTTTSIETQAVDLFAKGKGPIYAVRKLNMKIEETKKLYSNYLDATNHHTLTQVYKDVGEALPMFLKLFFKMRQANIDVDNVAKAVELVDIIPHIENQYKEKSENLRNTLEQEYSVMNEISRLEREKTALQNYNTSLGFESVSKQQELQNLNYEVGNLRTFIQEIKNGQDYQKIRLAVEEHVKRVMNDRMTVIEMAVNAAIEALQMNLAKKSFNNPYMQIAISGYSQQEVQYLRSNVLEIAKGLFERMISDFTKSIMMDLIYQNSMRALSAK